MTVKATAIRILFTKLIAKICRPNMTISTSTVVTTKRFRKIPPITPSAIPMIVISIFSR